MVCGKFIKNDKDPRSFPHDFISDILVENNNNRQDMLFDRYKSV